VSTIHSVSGGIKKEKKEPALHSGGSLAVWVAGASGLDAGVATAAQKRCCFPYFPPNFRKYPIFCRKLHFFYVAISRGCEKSAKKVKIFRKIGLTFGSVSGKILGTPSR